jgi:hypothetical protein
LRPPDLHCPRTKLPSSAAIAPRSRRAAAIRMAHHLPPRSMPRAEPYTARVAKSTRTGGLSGDDRKRRFPRESA